MSERNALGSHWLHGGDALQSSKAAFMQEDRSVSREQRDRRTVRQADGQTDREEYSLMRSECRPGFTKIFQTALWCSVLILPLDLSNTSWTI